MPNWVQILSEAKPKNSRIMSARKATKVSALIAVGCNGASYGETAVAIGGQPLQYQRASLRAAL